MGQDYSYSQSSSSDEYDITSLIQAEAELYGDEAESNYHIAEPLQYQPQPECDEGIPRICYCGGDPVVAISSTAKDPGRRKSFKEVKATGLQISLICSAFGKIKRKRLKYSGTRHKAAKVDIYILTCQLLQRVYKLKPDSEVLNKVKASLAARTTHTMRFVNNCLTLSCICPSRSFLMFLSSKSSTLARRCFRGNSRFVHIRVSGLMHSVYLRMI
ncbi:hypothetical protein Bca101_078854 [Brassica carinata]